MTLTVVSINVFGVPGVGRMKARLREICAEVAALDPDVVTFQEVYTWGVLGLIRQLMPGLPYAAYEAGRIGPSAALVTLSKRPVDRGLQQHLRLSNKLHTGGRGFRKGALACVVDGVEVVNFHLRSNPRARMDRQHPRVQAQAAQVGQLVEFIKGLGDGPMVVAGDSNIAHDGELYHMLVDGAGLTNAFNGEPTIVSARGQWCVDFIFVKGWGQVEAQTSHLFAGQIAPWTRALGWGRMGVVSDHKALCLRITQRI